MRDDQPIGLRRLLALRQFAMFEAVELDDLAMIAENVIEVSFARGATVAVPTPRLPALHLVLDGRIESQCGRGRGGRARAWDARQAFGALEVLSKRPLTAPAIAVVETRTLQLASSDVGEILEDSFGILSAVIRDLAARMFAVDRGVRSTTPRTPPLGLVDRIIVLREQLPFASAGIEAVATLAHQASEISWIGGDAIARAGQLGRDVFIVLDGNLVLDRAGSDPVRLGPGSEIGTLETLGGLRHAGTVTTLGPVHALRLSATTLFDVLEDHPELGRSMVAALAGALLDVRAPELRESQELPAAIN